METTPKIDGPDHSERPLSKSGSANSAASIPPWLAARRARSAQQTDSASEHHDRSDEESSRAPQIDIERKPEQVRSPLRSEKAANPRQLPAWLLFLQHSHSRVNLYGFSASLVLHLVLLFSLTAIVVRGKPPAVKTVVEAEFGHPGGDTIIDPDLEATLEMEGGHEAAALQVDVLDRPSVVDAIGFIPGESLEGRINGIGTGDGRGFGEGTGSGTGTGIGVPAINVPSFAVTKGSYSAWTQPRDPEPGQNYVIVIQVRVPKSIREYRGSDLTGMVTGTDKYKQVIKFKSTEKFPVKDGTVELRIPVPGGSKLVRDTIRLESRMLKEKQTLTIVF